MGAFDYTTNGVTMPAHSCKTEGRVSSLNKSNPIHSCKTASGGVWLREDMS